MTVRRKYIRSLVQRLLTEHHIQSAPVPIQAIAQSLGVKIQQKATEDELSGFLYKAPKLDLTVIGVNAIHHPNRQNFTIAHELGHFLLHDINDVHVDRQFKVWLRNETSSQGVDVREKEANLFAAELLMPVQFVEKDIAEIGTVDLLDDEGILAELAGRYGVSTQAMTFRLAYLGYISL
jgi:Zn-dependent peptidase ImmA (M78 family)